MRRLSDAAMLRQLRKALGNYIDGRTLSADSGLHKCIDELRARERERRKKVKR